MKEEKKVKDIIVVAGGMDLAEVRLILMNSNIDPDSVTIIEKPSDIMELSKPEPMTIENFKIEPINYTHIEKEKKYESQTWKPKWKRK